MELKQLCTSSPQQQQKGQHGDLFKLKYCLLPKSCGMNFKRKEISKNVEKYQYFLVKTHSRQFLNHFRFTFLSQAKVFLWFTHSFVRRKFPRRIYSAYIYSDRSRFQIYIDNFLKSPPILDWINLNIWIQTALSPPFDQIPQLFIKRS